MRKLRHILLGMMVACLAVVIIWNFISQPTIIDSSGLEKTGTENRIESGLLLDDGMSKQETKAARQDYFFRLLRNPVTNEIPVNIRARELDFAQRLPKHTVGGRYAKGAAATQSQHTPYEWISAGPQDVGGRTRALGIDQRDPNIIIAGGVSGGIWKSTDGGDSWEMKSDPSQNMSVTYLAQDPTAPDTWYYASGEFIGNSATDQGGRCSLLWNRDLQIN
ncbi:MAG: hypothetical protein U5K69_03290 [Balneolaceae bacterium]|nr:hypothetical protein [Balneolaceae bacterium]